MVMVLWHFEQADSGYVMTTVDTSDAYIIAINFIL